MDDEELSFQLGKRNKYFFELIDPRKKQKLKTDQMAYPFVFLNCIFYKIRHNGSVETREVYNILRVDIDGRKDLIGLYLSETEDAKFWLSVLTDLK